MLSNAEIEAIQNYANNVSITRIGLNDHGPVHMKTVCRNAMKMLSLLHEAGIETSLEKEHAGTFADSACGVMLAAMLHDSGMTIARKDHELYWLFCNLVEKDSLDERILLVSVVL